MKNIVLKSVFALSALSLIGLSFSMNARADGECAAEISKVLESKGITDYSAPDVERIPNPTDTGDLGYVLWFRLARCQKGYVVANVTPSCRIKSLYSRGGCQVDGLPSSSY